MENRTQILTRARLSRGLSYTGFKLRMTQKHEVIARWEASATLDPDDVAAFRQAAEAAGAPLTILVTVEDWCGDVCRELPTVAKLAAATGSDLRIFVRPEHPDIAALYLKNGRSHIPVFALFNREGRELGHLIERSAPASALAASTFAEFADRPRDEALAALYERFVAAYPGNLARETVHELTAIVAAGAPVPA